jgi:hypothetical protein
MTAKGGCVSRVEEIVKETQVMQETRSEQTKKTAKSNGLLFQRGNIAVTFYQ